MHAPIAASGALGRWPGADSAVGPYAAGLGQVRVGTASWTDRTLIEAGWYLPEAKGKAATSTSGPAGDSYSETQLREWAPPDRCPGPRHRRTHVLFNN